MIAEQLQRAIGADLFEIRTARPYLEHCEATVERAQQRDADPELPLVARVENIGGYDVVLLGFRSGAWHFLHRSGLF